MTEDIPDDLKQLEKEYNLTGGKWTTYTGIEANIKDNEFINNILSKMEEGQKIPVNGEPNTYAVKQGGRLLIVLPPKCVPNPDLMIDVKCDDRLPSGIGVMGKIRELPEGDQRVRIEGVVLNFGEEDRPLMYKDKEIGKIKDIEYDKEAGLIYQHFEITDEEALKEITKKVNNV